MFKYMVLAFSSGLPGACAIYWFRMKMNYIEAIKEVYLTISAGAGISALESATPYVEYANLLIGLCYVGMGLALVSILTVAAFGLRWIQETAPLEDRAWRLHEDYEFRRFVKDDNYEEVL